MSTQEILRPGEYTVQVPILLPSGALMQLDVRVVSEALSVDIDSAMDAAAKGTATVAKDVIARNFKNGRDAHGKKLPPLTEFSRDARRRRNGRKTKSGRERRVVDFNTPMFETGVTAAIVRVRKGSGPAKYNLESWIMGGADKKYDADRLVDYPAGEEDRMREEIIAAVDQAIK